MRDDVDAIAAGYRDADGVLRESASLIFAASTGARPRPGFARLEVGPRICSRYKSVPNLGATESSDQLAELIAILWCSQEQGGHDFLARGALALGGHSVN